MHSLKNITSKIMIVFIGLLVCQLDAMSRAYQMAPKKRELTSAEIETRKRVFDKLNAERIKKEVEKQVSSLQLTEKTVRKTPLQIQQEEQLKNIAENLKKDQVFIYQEGTVSGEIIPREVAEKCETVKKLIQDVVSKGEYPEIIIPVPYDNETIKNFCVVLQEKLEQSKPLTKTEEIKIKLYQKDALKYVMQQFQKHEQQRYKIIGHFSSLDQLVNVLLLSNYLDCKSSEAMTLVEQNFKHLINNIPFKFVTSINEYRFALSYFYNTGQQVPISQWGPPVFGDRVARRFKRNFRYYDGYFTSNNIKKRFENNLGNVPISTTLNALKKLSNDISNYYLDNSQVLDESKKIWENRGWVKVPDHQEAMKQNLEDVLYVQKNMRSIFIKWVAKFPEIILPILAKILTKKEYDDIQSKQQSQKATLLDAFQMLNDFLNAWHLILENAEKDWFL